MKFLILGWIILVLVPISSQTPYPDVSPSSSVVPVPPLTTASPYPGNSTNSTTAPSGFVPAPEWAHTPPGESPLMSDISKDLVQFFVNCLAIEKMVVDAYPKDKNKFPEEKAPVKCCQAELAMQVNKGSREHGWGMSKDCESYWPKAENGTLKFSKPE